jgi:HSP20 family protein
MTRIRNSWIKRQDHTHNGRIVKINFERKSKEPEPLIDVLDENDSVTVVAELAGFERRNITVRVKDQRLMLLAKTSDRKYRKSLNLPKRVIASTMYTKYKNGVLEIRFKKCLQEKTVDEVAGQKNAA